MSEHAEAGGRPDTRAALREGLAFARTIAYALLAALVLRTVVAQPFTIPSSSMEPGLVTGDYILVSKFDYGWSRASLPLNPPVFDGRLLARSPSRGDVVVFRLPRDETQTLIKRVVGLPGDRVAVRDGRVSVNGRPIPRALMGPVRDPDEPDRTVLQVEERTPDGRAYRTFDRGGGHEGDDTEAYVVPAGHYFMMGDNRDNSLDSRWPTETGVGFVPAENLLGRAQWILLSWKPGAALYKPWTWFNLQPDRFFRRLA